ncbi:nucleotide sugar dehydrogenase [Methanobacterium sp.]|uniref:nucleotide sugar dehydrogenase n=1 Tax=Methanobacterium sp. TaxID=2164 RepID=UPI003C787CF5
MILENSKITVFGLGHIGLPTAALFANSGLQVTGVDINTKTIEYVNKGKTPILEPGLDELVRKAVENGKLTATDDGITASKDSKIKIVIVPTPVDEFKKSDLSAVESACKSISKALNEDDLVIIESTIPPKTCENVVIPILEESGLKAGQDFGVAYTPERALPNNTIYEMTHNARVIGGINEKSADIAVSLYEHITKGKIIKVNDLITAEMVKLMENTYRDTNIALSNELAKVCEKLGIDAIEAIAAANHHPRVNIHTPGPGVGGHCLSIDPYFIVEIAEQEGIESTLIKNARAINDGMPGHVAEIVVATLNDAGKQIQNSKVGILGVAYKGNVADARETPAKPLIELLAKKGFDVCAHDPHTSSDLIKLFGAEPVSMEEVLKCDCVVLITDHDEYKSIMPNMIENKIFICTRPILNPDDFKREGVVFKGIGRL